jgi:hypothetical protein
MARLYERRGNDIIADRTDPNAFNGKCEFCGVDAELRPFGPNNESICFDCGMKDEETTRRKMIEMMNSH